MVIPPMHIAMGRRRERSSGLCERIGMQSNLSKGGEEVSQKRNIGRNRVLVIRCLVGAGGAKHE